MAKILVCYCSRTKHTEHMAEVIGKAAAGVAGVHVDVLPTGKVATRDLLGYDAILLGSPVFYGTISDHFGLRASFWAALPVTASMRRTPAPTLPSETTWKKPIWLPPQLMPTISPDALAGAAVVALT